MTCPENPVSSPSSLPFISSPPTFNSRDWINMSSPIDPSNDSHRHDHNAAKLIPRLDVFQSTSSASEIRSLNHINDSHRAYSLISPRSDTLPAAFDFDSSSIPPTPTPSYGHSNTSYSSMHSFGLRPLLYPLSPKHTKTSIPLPVTPLPKLSDRSQSSRWLTSPDLMYHDSPASVLPSLSPLLSLPRPRSPILMYPSFLSPVAPTSLNQAALRLLSSGFPLTLSDTDVDKDFDRYSFMNSDDWRLSQGLDPAVESGYAYNTNVYDDRCYTSPVLRRKSSAEMESPRDHTSPSTSTDSQENPFLQKLLEASAEHSQSGSQLTAPGTLVSERSSVSPIISSDTDIFDTEAARPYLSLTESPLTSLGNSPSISPPRPSFPSTDFIVQTPANIKSKPNQLSPLTPSSPVRSPRFARKPQSYFETRTPVRSRTPVPETSALTPSCTDGVQSKLASVSEDEVSGEGESKHRYRTRSKLVDIRKWVGTKGEMRQVNESGGKRKRVDEAELAKKAKKPRFTHATAKPEEHNDADEPDTGSVYAPSPLRRTSYSVRQLTSKTNKAVPSSENPGFLSLPLESTSSVLSLRTFPEDIPYHPEFPRFYRRFPASSLSSLEVNLYAPHSTRGTGTTKTGLCPVCVETTERGGEGKNVWLSMKFSAYKCYHMQYYHGISPRNGLPFSPPISFRISPRPHALATKHERREMLEGKCHECTKWIGLEGVKEGEAKVKEIYWWKHAVSCHQGSNIPGECDHLKIET